MDFDATTKAIPNAEALEKAAGLEVYDVNGKQVKFGSLYAEQKALVVFVRHFYCGSCQMYLQDLISTVSQEAFERAGTRVIVIGCGNHEPIQFYSKETGFQGPIYADPSLKVFRALGMTRQSIATTPAGETRASYMKVGKLANALKTIKRALLNPQYLTKQGPPGQLGGEFVLGPGNHCSFASRMRHAEGHVEVQELMKLIGVDTT